MTDKPKHSNLGGSGAERWMNCPGSNVMLQTLDLPESDESEFAAEGTAAHEVAAHCLRAGIDTWEIVGTKFYDHVVDQEMADGVQMYLDKVRDLRAEHLTFGNKRQCSLGYPIMKASFVEYRISGDWNDKFYGSVDSAEWSSDGETSVLDVTDFKYGAGIAVDADRNHQLMYYAIGMLEHRRADIVRLRIVQPRAFHVDGPDRMWETTGEELIRWKTEILIPAMTRAELDLTLTPGDWCRFCPAKLACPLLTALFGASAKADASVLSNLSPGSLAGNYALVAAVKHYIKALEEQVLKKLMHGEEIEGYKLVNKKSNRVFSTEGAATMKIDFGPDAFTPPELKTPAQLDKLGAKAKQFTKKWAYSPQTGQTVAPVDDPRPAINVRSGEEAFDKYRPLEDDTASE
jgi:hypothetical protein